MIRLLARTSAVFALALSLGCTDDPTGPSTADAVLITSATPITGISGSKGSRKLYRIVVPSGATGLQVTTAGGTGDVDLYIRYEAVPTLTRSDCASESDTNDEGCLESPVAVGDWYILLDGFETYSGVTLTATVQTQT
jgi:hypothetical protein